MPLGDLPRIRLAHLPTPLEEMAALRTAIRAAPRLFIKRDDCTGLAGGGNKTRKLEFALADAQATGADVIITSGGFQSNHVRQTAAAAAKLGLSFHGVLAKPCTGRPETTSACYVSGGNRLLGELTGGEFHEVADEGPATVAMIDRIVARSRADGRTPYVIPVGASDGIGAMGYVDCAEELLRQSAAQGISSSHLVVATGSAGTHGGLLAGLRRCGSSIQVIGISVSEPAAAKRDKVRSILEQLAPRLGSELPTIEDDEIIVHDEYVGGGYGVPTAGGVAAIRLTARTEGILLDPVYTGKAFAGYLDLLRWGPLQTGRDVMFLHTGGTPALFAYPKLFDEPRCEDPPLAS